MSTFVEKVKDTLQGGPIPTGQHLAAVFTSKGAPAEVVHRQTPAPGPNELLVEVKAVALNPIDVYQRDLGFFVGSYPAVSGSDTAGIVLAAGSEVPSDAPKPGTRVVAYAPCFFTKADPDHGAFQTRVVVPAVNAVPLPEKWTFKDGCVLPMAVMTGMAAWYTIGLPFDTAYTPADKQGMLVWGGASSIGTYGVQTAKQMGFTVYSTASPKHHDYIKSLGASKVFDYKDENVVDNMVEAMKEDGVTINMAYGCTRGSMLPSMQILKAMNPSGGAKLASAIPLTPDDPKIEGVEVKFVAAPSATEEERTQFFRDAWCTWFDQRFQKGDFVSSPPVQVVEGGLHSLNKALDTLKAGVSGTKLVLEV